MTRSCKEIRADFISYFSDKGHTFVPSSSLLPADDPTLMFANAGMNQYKDIFLGTATRDYVLAANSQKCIRAGGKHNDLEDVGHDNYHHTFFEMLGNWSFGQYFKKGAIEYAWDLLTNVWGLPKDRLYVTVFEGDKPEGLEPDDDARNLWASATDIDPSRILPGDKKDNFWEMGDTGPCGPCSEIHFDQTPDKSGKSLVNMDDPRVIEIWNLVFIQYNRDSSGKLTPLPAEHVDTGMGLERIGRIMQGKNSNYATDLFVPIIEKIETLTDHRYGADEELEDRFDVAGDDNIKDVACRVIADHIRSLTFAIADGILPSNEGRGYVIRRILRRASRYGRQYLNINGSFLAKLVDTVVDIMGEMFPEIVERKQLVLDTVREEEISFGRTLDRGIALFQQQADKLVETGKSMLSGNVAFDLYATYGFPVDLTQLMCREQNMTVDMDNYAQAMKQHRLKSQSDNAFKTEAISNLPPSDDSAKYAGGAMATKVLGWVVDNKYCNEGTIDTGSEVALITETTNFYGESGGQVGDTGRITWDGGEFAVTDTQISGDCVLHVGKVQSGSIKPGQDVTCTVNHSRMDITRNHTATHLLNWALRKAVNDDINQAGSVVSTERLRFDFAHNKSLTQEKKEEVERLVNARILADEAVTTKEMPLDEAKKIKGVRAVFGEKYGQEVRVITIGEKTPSDVVDHGCAVEFCGGTHMKRTGGIGLFKIMSEESAAKGVRRITAITGSAAIAYVQQIDSLVKEASAALKAPAVEMLDRIVAMQKEIKELRKKPASGSGAAQGFQQTGEVDSPNGKIVVGRMDQADQGTMRGFCDQQRQKGSAAVFVGGAADGKVMLIAMVSDELFKGSGVKAGDWVNEIAPIVGGAGGGKPTLAQAGGKDASKLDDALKAATDWVSAKLG